VTTASARERLLRTAPDRRRAWPAGDPGSLPLALLLTMVGTMLSALLVPMVLNQIEGTRDHIQRISALNAAQAGLEVALGHIQAANDGAGHGVLAKLPCGPLTGDVGVGGTARYQVTVDYLAVDPTGQPDSWIAANRLPCVAGAGTSTTPSYAFLRSQGTDQATGAFGSVPSRSLHATYTFQTTNEAPAGGTIRVENTSTGVDLCMDAGSSSPTAGSDLQMRPCIGGNRQNFAYNTNLTLVLLSSKTPSLPLGMCLDAGAPHAVGSHVRFQPCGSTTSPQQQWAFNENANFEGTTDGNTLDGYCFNVKYPNKIVVLGHTSNSTCRSGPDDVQTFSPEAAVGAGSAGSAADQLVNVEQFGRCLEVTGANSYLIAWPCKQTVDPANVSWKEKWALPAIPAGTDNGTGRITTNFPTGLHCLQSPLSTAAGQYVTVVSCPPSGTPLNMTWTVYGDTGVYETSYRIKDGGGNCLAPATSPTDLHPDGNQVSKVVVAACSGSPLQKWNARPNILQGPPLKDIGEK
jgi:hypothetical protein